MISVFKNDKIDVSDHVVMKDKTMAIMLKEANKNIITIHFRGLTTTYELPQFRKEKAILSYPFEFPQ